MSKIPAYTPVQTRAATQDNKFIGYDVFYKGHDVGTIVRHEDDQWTCIFRYRKGPNWIEINGTDRFATEKEAKDTLVTAATSNVNWVHTP